MNNKIQRFIDEVTKKYPAPVLPLKQKPVFVSNNGGDIDDALTRVCEPPCFKELWDTGSSEGRRNADRYALLARFYACGVAEDDALELRVWFQSSHTSLLLLVSWGMCSSSRSPPRG